VYFDDRADAGRRLAERLSFLRGEPLVVLGLPRGGVVVASQVATALDAPLDVILVRKLGVPWQPELAMGAIGEGGVLVLDDERIGQAGVGDAQLAEVVRRERAELEQRRGRLSPGRRPVPLGGRAALVVDDGLATGSTARAACAVARAHGAARVLLAVPVAPRGWAGRLGSVADDYVCLHAADSFSGVSQFYGDFAATTDDEVLALIRQAPARGPEHPGGTPRSARAGSDILPPWGEHAEPRRHAGEWLPLSGCSPLPRR
jgi:putative phosphoribosyl transferase